MTSSLRESARAESIPRYEQPSWEELQESCEDEEQLTCYYCERYFACGHTEARTVANSISIYCDLGRSEKGKKAVERAVLSCGVCARRLTLVSCADPICDEYKERQ